MLREVTVKLQYEASDVLRAYSKIHDVFTDQQKLKSNAEDKFSKLFLKIYEKAQSLEIEVQIPRRVGRQFNRGNNAPATTPEQHYGRNLFLPFLNHIVSDMSDRFDTVRAGKLFKIL